MKKIRNICLILAGVFTLAGCEDYLDVNTNPNGPDALLQPELFLPQIQSELAVAVQWDGKFAGIYTQNWITSGSTTSSPALNFHANPLTDNYAQLWRAVYWSMGYNLSDMIESGKLNEKYDFVGVGYILRAYGWQMLTDYHGPVIVTQAFDSERRVFDYDEQEVVYAEIERLLLLGIENLERTDGLSPEDSGLREADLIYNGDREKWKKFAYGLLAISKHRLTNKSFYDPQEVISYANQALASNADNALIRFEGTVTANSNHFGPIRGVNGIATYRQSKFIVGLLDGSNPELSDPDLAGADPVFEDEHLKDPRLTAMLAPAPDGEYRGVSPEIGTSEYVPEQTPKNLWNNVGNATATPSPQIYFFANDARFPLMTYSQIQFIKAEAAWIANQKELALSAYTEGVEAHLDFARQYAPDPATYDQRRALYEASEEYMPTSVDELTLSKIMLQKYIATWGWGFFETWSDMRRYHYDQDAAIEENVVYKGFTLPNPLYLDNNEKPAYRARPRFNSEYMWNKEALEELDAFEPDYHTYETWFSKPE